MTVAKLFPDIDCVEVVQIATVANLTGKLFTKKSPEFKNSKSFGMIFKTITNMNRKQWQTIYKKINKWKSLNEKGAYNEANLNAAEQKQFDYIDQGTYNEANINAAEQKQIDYIDQGTDTDIIHTFCAITNANENTAAYFLAQLQYNINTAIDKYYAFNGNPNYLDTDDKKHHDDPIIYSHGVQCLYWDSQQEMKGYIEKHFSNLKEEMLHFKQFSVKEWEALHSECIMLLQVDRIRQIVSNGHNHDIYGIKAGHSLTTNHLISIKLYTDFTWLCKIFCEAFRLKKVSQHQYERVQSLRIRNSKIANMARLLTEAVQSYGKLRGISSLNKNKTYYRGINSEFVFKRLVTQFYVPLSTTYDLNKAAEFAQRNGNGLIIELKVYNELVSCLNTSTMSAFPDEKEVLFFGNASILHISSMRQLYNEVWTSYRKHINGIKNILNIANGSIKWNRANNMKDIVGYLLPDLNGNNVKLPPYIEMLLNYHLQNVPNRIEYDFRELAHQYQWVQDIFVMDEGVPNVANACNLFPKCNNIIFVMSENDTMNTTQQCNAVLFNMLNISNDKVAIKFKWISSKSLDEIEIKFRKCSHEFESLILETEIDETSNSITIWPTIIPSKPTISSPVFRIHKHHISANHIYTIEGYIRMFVTTKSKIFVPQNIMDLVLFFYSKPIIMNIEHGNKFKCVIYSPITPITAAQGVGKAIDKDNKQTTVAVKIIRKQKAISQTLYKNQVDILSRIEHPHIGEYIDSTEDDIGYYVFTDLYEGGHLFDRIINPEYNITEKVAATLIHDMLITIEYLHNKNIVHRDLKPENFVFENSSLSANIRLINFGLAKIV
eukprot:447175_1